MPYVKTRADSLATAIKRVTKREKATQYSGLFGNLRKPVKVTHISEVVQLMKIVYNLSIYTKFRVACAFHMINARQGLDEAIADWLKKNKMEENLPRWYEAAAKQKEEKKEARRLARQKKKEQL